MKLSCTDTPYVRPSVNRSTSFSRVSRTDEENWYVVQGSQRTTPSVVANGSRGVGGVAARGYNKVKQRPVEHGYHDVFARAWLLWYVCVFTDATKRVSYLGRCPKDCRRHRTKGKRGVPDPQRDILNCATTAFDNKHRKPTLHSSNRAAPVGHQTPAEPAHPRE